MNGKFPPLEKFYEAWSAIADGRVRMEPGATPQEGTAVVESSNGAKTYTVQWHGHRYLSNDNATYWQGYAGYPVLAVLMLNGKLPYDGEIAACFAGIDWHAANAKARGDYSLALQEVEKRLNLPPDRLAAIGAHAQSALAALKTLDISVGRYRQGK